MYIQLYLYGDRIRINDAVSTSDVIAKGYKSDRT